MIASIRDRATERFVAGEPVRQFEGFVEQARRRIAILDSATALEDLARLPSNRLEALGGDRAGQFSIRINDQWRLCFEWTSEGAANVEIVDYH